MQLKSAIKRVLPPSVFFQIRSLPYRVIDAIHPPPEGEIIPPLRMQLDGPRGYDVFRANGDEALRFYKEKVGLSPDATMLDIGCGIGRKTLPLTRYLSDDALYVGIDIDEGGIKWCSRHISTAYPRFVFFGLDIANEFYNPAGGIQADKLVLPFPEQSFDLVSLWSVFTHMHPSHIAHYLQEVHRVLKPGGKVVASYYVMDEHARQAVQAGRALWNVEHYLSELGCWTVNPNIPEDLIALEEAWLQRAYRDTGLRVLDPVFKGGWANRKVEDAFANINTQDIVIAARAA